MIDYWDKSERFQGIVYKNNEELGECRFVFHWNPYLTNEMEVEIFDAPQSLISLGGTSKNKTDLKIIGEYGKELTYLFALRPDLASTSLRFRESVMSMPVEKFITKRNFETEKCPSEFSAQINFPLTATTNYKHHKIEHPSYGFFHGKIDGSRQDIAELKRNDLEIETEIGLVKIGDRFRFKESKKTPEHKEYFPVKLLTKHSTMVWHRNITKLDEANNAMSAFEKKAGEILSLISLSERNRFDWSHSSYTILGGGKSSHIQFKDTYKYMGLPVKNGFGKNTPMNSLHAFLSKAVSKFEALNAHKRNEILKLIDHFQIANLARTFEDSFIRWHSILDFLRNKFGKGGRNPSQQIRRTFQSLNITIDDLIDKDILKKVETDSNSKFIFTDLRDKYIHSGFDVFDDNYDLGFEQERIMRAMAERLLLHRMDIDYRETHLGTTNFI